MIEDIMELENQSHSGKPRGQKSAAKPSPMVRATRHSAFPADRRLHSFDALRPMLLFWYLSFCQGDSNNYRILDASTGQLLSPKKSSSYRVPRSRGGSDNRKKKDDHNVSKYILNKHWCEIFLHAERCFPSDTSVWCRFCISKFCGHKQNVDVGRWFHPDRFIKWRTCLLLLARSVRHPGTLISKPDRLLSQVAHACSVVSWKCALPGKTIWVYSFACVPNRI